MELPLKQSLLRIMCGLLLRDHSAPELSIYPEIICNTSCPLFLANSGCKDNWISTVYLSAAPKFPAQPRIVRGTITEGSSALCLISFVNPLNAVAAGSPAHHGASTSLPSPGGLCLPRNPSPRRGHRGKGDPHLHEAGRGCRKNSVGGGRRRGVGKGKAAWCPSVPSCADSQRGFRCPQGTSEAHPPPLSPSSPQQEWRGQVSQTGQKAQLAHPHRGSRHQATRWACSLEKANLSHATKEGSLQISTHCTTLPQQPVFLNKFLPDWEKGGGGDKKKVPRVLSILHAHKRWTSLWKQNAQSCRLKGASIWLRPGATNCSCERRQVREAAEEPPPPSPACPRHWPCPGPAGPTDVRDGTAGAAGCSPRPLCSRIPATTLVKVSTAGERPKRPWQVLKGPRRF